MANNNNVEIKIGTRVDTKGVDQAKKSVNEMSETAKNLSRQTGEAAGAVSALGGAVGILNPQMGSAIQMTAGLTNGIKGLSLALKSLLTNPIALAIAAIAAAIAAFQHHVNKARGAWEELYAKLQLSIADKIAERNREVAKSFQQMSFAIEDASDKLQHYQELAGMDKGSKRAVEDANTRMEKTKELSQATTDEERQEIENKYAKSQIDIDTKRRKEDITTSADRTWNDTLAKNSSKERNQLKQELKAIEANINNTQNGLMKNADTFKKYGGEREATFMKLRDETDAKDKQAIQKAEADKRQYTQQLSDLEMKRAEIQNKLMKNEREQAQAIEKRKKILESLNTVDEEAKAKQAELNAKIEDEKRRADERKADYSRSLDEGNSRLYDSRDEADRESAWRRQFEKEDAEGKRIMLEQKRDDAMSDESKAKERMEKLTEALKGETDERKRVEMERDLGDAREDFTKGANVRRSAEEALRGFDGKDDGTIFGTKLNDRISAMGGFATAGAKASAGIQFASPEKQLEQESKKQSEYQKESRDYLKKIASNTDGKDSVTQSSEVQFQ